VSLIELRCIYRSKVGSGGRISFAKLCFYKFEYGTESRKINKLILTTA